MYDGPLDAYAHIESFDALADAAHEKLLLLGRGTGLVSGPITTGGLGSKDENLLLFGHTIDRLRQTYKLFDQRPFEHAIHRLRVNWVAAGNAGYCDPILHVFYRRVIHSGLIGYAFFIPGWESSVGARWEHDELRKAGARIEYLSASWFSQEFEVELDQLLAA
jgi:hypothetical protein